MDMGQAKKLCPNIMFQHVATWREGEDKWAYRDDPATHIATQKVSLDPYRAESRKILACIKAHLPAAPVQRVEKASVDEVFLDLSAQIHGILLDRYPEELARPPPYDDPTENLPSPPTTVLDWKADALVDLDVGETELDDPDWDDITMLIGSEIVRSIRAAVREELRYTCSAGVARNKMLAKLGSGAHKPNQQTVVRNRAAQQFLDGFKFTKIRNLGGKLGEQVVAAFGTDTVRELLKVPLDTMKNKLDDDAGAWIYKIIRGDDLSEVTQRTEIKSMLSAKSFRPCINTEDQAVKWLRIFVADIFNRLIDIGLLENKRRPRTINLHHRQGGVTRSRQLPIATGRKLDENVLFELSRTLLDQVIVDGRAWPCANLSLSVGGFDEGMAGNRTLGGFVLKGEAAKAMNESMPRPESHPRNDDSHLNKRRRTDEGGIQKFFTRHDSSREEHDEDFGVERMPAPDTRPSSATVQETIRRPASGNFDRLGADTPDVGIVTTPEDITENYVCAKCQASVPVDEQGEHEDWHFAKDLQAEEREPRSNSTENNATVKKPKAVKPQKGPRKPGGGGDERGQRKLVWGK